MELRYVRSHGLGNDYLVVDPATFPLELTPARIRQICDRPCRGDLHRSTKRGPGPPPGSPVASSQRVLDGPEGPSRDSTPFNRDLPWAARE